MEMSDYETWSEKHALIFSWSGEKDAAMLASWQTVFDGNGYTIEELTEATRQLASVPPIPKTRPENLDGIHRAIGLRRAAMARANEELDRQREPGCEQCGHGKGWVVVPHLKSVVDGEWARPFYTFAVVCTCLAGDKIIASWNTPGKTEPKRAMQLRNYEIRNPLWAHQVARREKQTAAERAARQDAEYVEKSASTGPFDAAMDRIKLRSGIP